MGALSVSVADSAQARTPASSGMTVPFIDPSLCWTDVSRSAAAMTAALDLMNNIGRCFPLSLQGLCHAFVEAKPVVDASREFLLIVTYVDQRCPESFTQCGDDVSQMGSLLFVETLTGLIEDEQGGVLDKRSGQKDH